jgi:hypothetical protein
MTSLIGCPALAGVTPAARSRRPRRLEQGLAIWQGGLGAPRSKPLSATRRRPFKTRRPFGWARAGEAPSDSATAPELVDRDLALGTLSTNAIDAWQHLAPVTAMPRRRSNTVWENFEYLVALCEDWLASHPRGSYPEGMRRIRLKDEWLEADQKYSASLSAT